MHNIKTAAAKINGCLVISFMLATLAKGAEIIIASQNTGILDIRDFSSIFVTPGYHKLQLQGASFLDKETLKYVQSKDLECFFDNVKNIKTGENASVYFVIVEGTNVTVVFESDFIFDDRPVNVDVNILQYGGENVDSLAIENMDQPTYNTTNMIHVYPQFQFFESGILHSCEMHVRIAGTVALTIMRPTEKLVLRKIVNLVDGNSTLQSGSIPKSLMKIKDIFLYANETGPQRFIFKNVHVWIQPGDVIGIDFSRTTATINHYFFGKSTDKYIQHTESYYTKQSTSSNTSQPIMSFYLSKPFIYEYKILPQNQEALLTFDARITWKEKTFYEKSSIHVQVAISGLRMMEGRPKTAPKGSYNLNEIIVFSPEVMKGSDVKITGHVLTNNMTFDMINRGNTTVNTSLFGTGFHVLQVVASNKISKEELKVKFAILMGVESFQMNISKRTVDTNEPVNLILKFFMGLKVQLDLYVGRNHSSRIIMIKDTVTTLVEKLRFSSCGKIKIKAAVNDFTGNVYTEEQILTVACFVQGLSVMTIPAETTNKYVRLSIADMLQIEISLEKGSYVTYYTEWGDNRTDTTEQKTSLYPKDFGMRHKYGHIGNYTLRVTANSKHKNISIELKIQVVKCFVPPVMFFYGSKERPIVISRGIDKVFAATWSYMDQECYELIERDFLPTYWILRSENFYRTVKAKKETLKVEYLVKKLSLNSGNYIISLKLQYKSYEFTLDGYFKIVQSPLVAEIRNGILQIIPLKSKKTKSFYDFQIIGADSYDPDKKEEGATNLTLYWRCKCLSSDEEILNAKEKTTISKAQDDNLCLNNKQFESVSRFSKSHGYLDFITSMFLENITYQIELIVGQTSRKTSSAFQKFKFVDGEPPNINIRCINNCAKKINPLEKFSLQYQCVDCLPNTRIIGEWKIKKEVNGSFVTADDIDDKSLDTDLNSPNLVIKPNVLQENKTYEMSLLVHYQDQRSYAKAILRKTVSHLPYGGSCEVWPEKGYAGITHFSIKCRNWQNSEKPTSYEIRYNKYEKMKYLVDLPILNPTSLDLPYLTNIIMPAGIPSVGYKIGISVRIINKYKAYSTYENLNITVEPPNITGDNFYKSLERILEMSHPKDLNDTKQVSMFVEAIVSIMSFKINELKNMTVNSKYINELINTAHNYGKYFDYLSGVVPMSFTESKCLGDTLLSVTNLLKVLPPINIPLDPTSLLNKIAIKMEMYSYEQESQYLEMSFQNMFTTIDSLLKFKEASLKTNLYETEERELINRNQQRRISSLTNGMDVFLKTLAKKKTPDEASSKIVRENYRSETLKTERARLIGYSISVEGNNSVRLPSSINVLKKTEKHDVISLQAGVYFENIYNWDEDKSDDIKSKIQFLSFKDKFGDDINVKNLDEPIEIYLQSNLESFKSYNVNLSSSSDYEELEIEISTKCNLMLQLLAYEEANEATTLVVYLQYGKPVSNSDYDVMITLHNSTIDIEKLSPYDAKYNSNDTTNLYANNSSEKRNVYVNKTNNNIITMSNFKFYKYGNSTDKKLYVKMSYEGPSPPSYTISNRYTYDVYEVQSSYNYSLKVFCAECVYWNVTVNKWKSDGCQIDLGKSNFTSMRCLCNHLTSFGAFYVAPNPLPRLSFVLLKQGYVLLITVVSLMLIWLLAMVFLRRWDKKDESKIGITSLIDNNPQHNYLYEITVSTGSRRNAGTTSNVYFMAVGSLGDSGLRKLEDNHRKLFQRSSSDIFVISVAGSLGDLQCIKLWHDNSGGDWFIRSIEILDVQKNEKSFFIASRWLAVDKNDGRLFCVIPRAANDELTDFTYIFTTKSRRDFTDTHIWFSLYARPVRSSFTRCQRWTVAVCMILTAMLASVMFYGRLPPRRAETENRIAGFSFSWQQVYVAIIGSIITVPVNVILVTLFRSIKPKPVTPEWKKSSRTSSYEMEEEEEPLIESDGDEKVDEANCRKKCGKFFKLPYWFIYITWLLCVAVIFTCGFLITLYGMSFGNRRSLDWLASVTIYLGQDILLLQPFKIVVGAIFIALFIKKIEQSEHSYIQKKNRKFYKNKNWLRNNKMRRKTILSRFKVEEVKPLDEEHLQTMREIRFKERQMYAIMREMALYFVFTIVIFSIGYISRDPSSFRQTRDIEEMLSLKTRTNMQLNYTNSFFTLRSHKDFWPWLERTFTKRVFPEPWYTDLDESYQSFPSIYNFPEKKFAEDLYSKIVNGIRIRQVRVKSGSCKKHKAVLKISHQDCANSYSLDSEEKRSFLFNWSIPINKNEKKKMLFDKYKPWFYQTWKELDSYPFFAELNSYFGGGYVLELFPRWNNTANILKLKRNLWIDRYTRAIFLEFALFNAATNLFSSVTITLELPPGGGVIPYYSIITFRLHRYNINSAVAVIISEVLFVILTFIFTLREIKMIYKEKWPYFKEFWNLVEFANIILTCLAICFYVYRTVLGRKLMKRLTVKKPDKFINFQFAAYWDQCFIYIIALLCFFVTIKFLKLLRFNNRICLLAHTLKAAWYPLMMFGTCFAIIMIAMMVSSTIIFGTLLYGYRDITKTISSVIGLLLGKFDYYQFENSNRVLGPVFFFTFNVLINWIVMNMMISILNDVFANQRCELITKFNQYEIVEFVVNSVKDWLGIKRSKSNIEKLWLETLKSSKTRNQVEKIKDKKQEDENKKKQINIDEIMNSERWLNSESFLHNETEEKEEEFENEDEFTEKFVYALNYLYFDDAQVAKEVSSRVMDEFEGKVPETNYDNYTIYDNLIFDTKF